MENNNKKLNRVDICTILEIFDSYFIKDKYRGRIVSSIGDYNYKIYMIIFGYLNIKNVVLGLDIFITVKKYNSNVQYIVEINDTDIYDDDTLLYPIVLCKLSKMGENKYEPINTLKYVTELLEDINIFEKSKNKSARNICIE